MSKDYQKTIKQIERWRSRNLRELEISYPIAVKKNQVWFHRELQFIINIIDIKDDQILIEIYDKFYVDGTLHELLDQFSLIGDV